MKLGTLISLLIFASAVTTQAAPLSSRVDHLNRFFAQGTPATEQELNGWWSGRCYRATAPDTATNSLLVTWTSELPLENGVINEGPLFTSQKAQSVFNMTIINNKKKVDQFDTLQVIDKHNAESTIARLANTMTFVENNALTSLYEEGNLKISIRRHQNYFIGLMTTVSAEANLPAGSLYAACYYFKQVN